MKNFGQAKFLTVCVYLSPWKFWTDYTRYTYPYISSPLTLQFEFCGYNKTLQCHSMKWAHNVWTHKITRSMVRETHVSASIEPKFCWTDLIIWVIWQISVVVCFVVFLIFESCQYDHKSSLWKVQLDPPNYVPQAKQVPGPGEKPPTSSIKGLTNNLLLEQKYGSKSFSGTA